MIIEVCAGGLRDCVVAQANGAHRIELNSALHLGGLTPSLGTLMAVKEAVQLPIICMLRPRGAGFYYDTYDKVTMRQDAQLLLSHGADGLAFGSLTAEATLDVAFTQELIDLCHQYGKTAVFHRAFDVAQDPEKVLSQLITLGCDRILTSGLAEKAIDGAALLRRLQATYGDDIQLCVGAGVSAATVKDLIAQTDIQQYHASCKDWYPDPTTSGNGVSYQYGEGLAYDGASPLMVAQLVEASQVKEEF